MCVCVGGGVHETSKIYNWEALKRRPVPLRKQVRWIVHNFSRQYTLIRHLR
jgi:hypothetical protein